MTREEAINFGEMFLEVNKDSKNSNTYEFVEMAIKALEQEPCEDAISRQDVLELAKKGVLISNGNHKSVCNAINELPSVTSQQRWIPVNERLPRDGSWNIFTDGTTISVERYKADAIDHFYPNGRWFSLDETIAWMPLPEPYKAESKEEQKPKTLLDNVAEWNRAIEKRGFIN